MVFQRLIAVSVLGLVVGCSTQTALKIERSTLGRASVDAERLIVNNLNVKENATFTVRSLDPQSEHAIEYRTLATSLTTALREAGLKPSDKPQTLFLVGYALELGKNKMWDRTIVIYGYDVASGKRTYQARITSSGRTASAYEVGDAVFPRLAEDLRKTGEIKDKISVASMTRS